MQPNSAHLEIIRAALQQGEPTGKQREAALESLAALGQQRDRAVDAVRRVIASRAELKRSSNAFAQWFATLDSLPAALSAVQPEATR